MNYCKKVYTCHIMKTDEEHKQWVISLLGEAHYKEHYETMWGSCKKLPSDFTPCLIKGVYILSMMRVTMNETFL